MDEFDVSSVITGMDDFDLEAENGGYGARIEAIKPFYGKVDNIQVVMNKVTSKKLSEAQLGSWAIDEMDSGLKAYNLTPFVVGSDEVPTIDSQEMYVKNGLMEHSEDLKLLSGICKSRLAQRGELNKDCESIKQRIDSLEQIKPVLEVDESTTEEGKVEAVKKHKKETKVWESEFKTAKKERMNIDTKLLDINKKFLEDKEAYDKKKKDITENAIKIYNRDYDALMNFKKSVNMMYNHVLAIIKEAPGIEIVARSMDYCEFDPLEQRDLKEIRNNLVKKYRKDDPLQVSTMFVNAFKDLKQSKYNTKAEYVREVQRFLQSLMKIKVRSLSIEEVVGIIAVGNSDEKTRTKLLQNEQVIAMTVGYLNDDESTVNADKGSMYDRFMKFHRHEDTTDEYLKQFDSKGTNSNSKDSSATDVKELKKLVKNNQNMYLMQMEKAGQCKSFILTGECKNNNCEKKHDRESSLVKQNVSSGVCFNFKNSGECKFGDRCRFSHDLGEETSKTNNGKNGNNSNKNGSNANNSSNSSGNKGQQSSDKKGAANGVFHAKSYQSNKVVELSDSEEFNMLLPVETRILEDDDENEVVMANVANNGQSDRCIWDSGTTVSAQSNSANVVNIKRLKKETVADGVGGKVSMKLTGYNEKYDMQVNIIEGANANTPVLMSVAAEATKNESVFIFTDKGGIELKGEPNMVAKLFKVIETAENDGRVIRQATLRGGVYVDNASKNHVSFNEGGNDLIALINEYKYASGRVKLNASSVDEVLEYLVESGFSKAMIAAATKHKSIGSFPEGIDENAINQYFDNNSPSVDTVEATVIKAPLKAPSDYVRIETKDTGEILLADGIDMSCARLKAKGKAKEDEEEGNSRATVVPSLGGYTTAVLFVDEGSGYHEVEGRVNKKDPEKIVLQAVARWIAKWKRLKYVKVDSEFATKAGHQAMAAMNVNFLVSVPSDHRHVTGRVEGCVRHIQDKAQANMNRVRQLIKMGVLSEKEHTQLWFQALMHAAYVTNFKPAFNDPTITRWEAWLGYKLSLSTFLIMPFGLRVVARHKSSTSGRGIEGLYMVPSFRSPGCIYVLNLETMRTILVYSFKIIRQSKVRASEAMLQKVSRNMYGKLIDTEKIVEESVDFKPVDKVIIEDTSGDKVTSKVELRVSPTVEVRGEIDPQTVEDNNVKDKINEEIVVNCEQPANIVLGENGVSANQAGDTVNNGDVLSVKENDVKGVQRVGIGDKVRKKNEVISNYGTRSKAAVLALEVEEEVAKIRPPKPDIPPERVCAQSERWKAADLREAAKLMEEDTFTPLPLDENGKPIRPEGCIVLKLWRVREIKWKPDPDTGEEVWLECSRIVVDGSADKRKENFYAETPDRTLLFVLTSLGASHGESVMGSDVTRAYLNAPCMDRNVVIVAPANIHGVPRESLLNKGLYGTRNGALSWQMWIENILMDKLKYNKCCIAIGVYMYKLENGEWLRILRHSDDFRNSSKDHEGMLKEQAKMRSEVRMAEFTELDRFLGCAFETIDIESGQRDSRGKIVLVRQYDKIMEGKEKFKHISEKFNPKHYTRKSSMPMNAIRRDEELDPNKEGRYLSAKELEIFQAACGLLNWIVCSTRPDCKFAYFVCATRLASARVWDVMLAMWLLDFLVATANAPLVLGGNDIDPVVYSDASYGTLNEGRSVAGHCVIMGKDSGAVYANCSAIKCAVDSVWEAELNAKAAGANSALYIKNLCKEMEYKIPDCIRVLGDNEAVIKWTEGSAPSKKSRHVDIRFHRLRHLQEENLISVEYVSTNDNIADILTKPLSGPKFRDLAGRILGHRLVQHLPIEGIFKKSSELEELLFCATCEEWEINL